MPKQLDFEKLLNLSSLATKPLAFFKRQSLVFAIFCVLTIGQIAIAESNQFNQELIFQEKQTTKSFQKHTSTGLSNHQGLSTFEFVNHELFQIENSEKGSSKYDTNENHNVTTENLSMEITSRQNTYNHRQLDTIVSNQIQIQGSSYYAANTLFSYSSGSSNAAMITVDSSTYQGGLEAVFTNCTFNISGYLFQSNLPISLIFINCTFNLANIVELISVTYSDSACNPNNNYGDISFYKCIFQDGGLQTIQMPTSATTQYILNAVTLYKVQFNSSTFQDMNYKHKIMVQDSACATTRSLPQVISLDNLEFKNTNLIFGFEFDYMQNATGQLNFSISNIKASNLTLPNDFITVNQISQSLAIYSVQNMTLQSVYLSGKFLNLNIVGANATFYNISAQQCKMNEFLKVSQSQNASFSKIKALNILNNNQIDATKALIVASKISNKVNLESMYFKDSTLLYTSAILIDSVSSLTLQNSTFNNITIYNSNFIIIKTLARLLVRNTSFNMIMTNSEMTSYAIEYDAMQAIAGISTYNIDNVTLTQSEVALLQANSFSYASSSDTSQYSMTISNCIFSSNTLSGFNLLEFNSITANNLELYNQNCIPASYIQSCEAGQYFSPLLNECQSCPNGCATCNSDISCLTCTDQQMTVVSGFCKCPAQQYLWSSDQRTCKKCLSKCESCSNEYNCITYMTCPNTFQTLNSNTKLCEFQCAAIGYQVSASQCGSCSDQNCQLCTVNNDISAGLSNQQCGQCKDGYFLDLKTYTCMADCPSLSKAITTTNTHDKMGTRIQYCRPYAYNQQFTYEYWVNPSSTSYFELGTYEHPFKNLASPPVEVFNFMYDIGTNFTVYHKRGTTMKIYYGLMPLILLNLRMYKLTTYGDQNLAKPYIYITDHPYLWPDSTLFSLAENYYDLSKRVSRGDMAQSEASNYFLKFNIFRSNLTIHDLDFQSIMFGDAWSNPLIYSFDNYNSTAIVNGSYLDLDGSFFECYSPIGLHVYNAHFNLTNYQYGIWNDFRWDCVANNATDIIAFLRIENSLFTDYHQQALYNFIYYSSPDSGELVNNTFRECTYLDMQTRPFIDFHPQSLCDPAYRTQYLTFDSNKFINLTNSNIIFNINYMKTYSGTKIFSMQNNYYKDCVINTGFIQLQILQEMKVTVANNYYENVTITNGNYIYYFFSELSNLTITNETLKNNKLDDLYQIGSANNFKLKDFKVSGNTNTGQITETSSIIRVSIVSGTADIDNFQVINSTFMYGKALNIESAQQLNLQNSYYFNNILENQDFLTFSQIQAAQIQNIKFDKIQKSSDKARFVISFQSLTLVADKSKFTLKNITFQSSQSSFIAVSQVTLMTGAETSNYQFMISDCEVNQNTLSSKDSLFNFGEINYINFNVMLDKVNLYMNILELGTIYSLQMNSKMMSVKNSMVLNNVGQFALLQPASANSANPLIFYIQNTTFFQNYAAADALVQLTTNSLLYVTDSNFTENYSIGRGSIVFADYQAVYGKFTNCMIKNNYAYQGGAFYIQYSSQIEISNCTLTGNFAVTGGVAYVNNDGFIRINKGSKVYLNSALNSCFLFLINTQQESYIDDVMITKNDQMHPIIDKSLFLAQITAYKYITAIFFQAMQSNYDKVSRTINEKTDSAVYAIKAKINFTNSNIQDNDIFLSASTQSVVSMANTSLSAILASGKIISAVSSIIEFNNVTINNITYNSSQQSSTGTSTFYKISVVNQSTLRAQKTTLSQILGPLLYVSGSTISIQDKSILFNNTNDDQQNPLLQIDTSQVTVSDTMFKNLSSTYYSPIINLQSNTFQMTNIDVRNFDKTLFSCTLGDYMFNYLTVNEGQILSASNSMMMIANSIVFDIDSANVKLNNTQVNGIYTQSSSPVMLIQNSASASSTIQLNIHNSQFSNNSALDSAGAIKLLNTNLNMTNSTFFNNTAITNDAGALYLDCDESALYQCIYTIDNSSFIKNNAHINGGAIKYTFYQPSITKTIFLNNSAQYGQDLSSYATKMSIQTLSPNRRILLSQLNSTMVANLGLQNALIYQLDKDLVSGSLMTQNVTFTLYDRYNNITNTDNSSTATMNSMSSSVQVMKSKSVKAINGSYSFYDVIIIGPPGTFITVKITSDAISTNKISKAFPELGTYNDIYLTGFLRLCTRGEYQSSDNKCIQCQDGFFTVSENQTQCQECPEHAQCINGYQIIVNQGYWRKDVNSTNIFECFNSDACLSSYEPTCASGYGGNLCSTCVKYEDKWFARDSDYNCKECIDKQKNKLRMAGVSVLVIVYFALLIAINIRSAGRQSNSTVAMRILTNYFQILTVTSSYELTWTDNLKVFLKNISFISQASNMLLSADCFIRENGITTNPIFVKMIIACMLPLGCILIITIFWFIFKLFRRSIQIKQNLVLSVIVLIFVCLPSITTVTFAIFNCQDIFSNKESYLAADMSVKCWAGQHLHYAKSYGIPIVLFWIVGLPLIAFAQMFRIRNKLQDYDNIATYGFLYLGLNSSCFYWEILLHFRKVLMISINVFFTTFKPLYRALIGFMLMIVYIEFLQKMMPYQTPEMNDLELKANIAAFATFYGGLFFISEDLPTSVSTFLFLLILFINLVFWLTWIKIAFNKKYLFVKQWILKKLCPKIHKKLFDFSEIAKLEGDLEQMGNNNDSKFLEQDSFRHDQSQAKLMLGDTTRKDVNGVFTDRIPLNKSTLGQQNFDNIDGANYDHSAMMINYSNNDNIIASRKKKQDAKKKTNDKNDKGYEDFVASMPNEFGQSVKSKSQKEKKKKTKGKKVEVSSEDETERSSEKNSSLKESGKTAKISYKKRDASIDQEVYSNQMTNLEKKKTDQKTIDPDIVEPYIKLSDKESFSIMNQQTKQVGKKKKVVQSSDDEKPTPQIQEMSKSLEDLQESGSDAVEQQFNSVLGKNSISNTFKNSYRAFQTVLPSNFGQTVEKNAQQSANAHNVKYKKQRQAQQEIVGMHQNRMATTAHMKKRDKMANEKDNNYMKAGKSSGEEDDVVNQRQQNQKKKNTEFMGYEKERNRDKTLQQNQLEVDESDQIPKQKKKSRNIRMDKSVSSSDDDKRIVQKVNQKSKSKSKQMTQLGNEQDEGLEQNTEQIVNQRQSKNRRQNQQPLEESSEDLPKVQEKRKKPKKKQSLKGKILTKFENSSDN